jgi:hypothetical protein
MTCINYDFVHLDCADVFDLRSEENDHHAIQMQAALRQLDAALGFGIEVVVQNLNSHEEGSVVGVVQNSKDLHHPVHESLSVLVSDFMVEYFLIF